jgi:cold shock protein
MPTGTVKKYFEDRRFGFVARDDDSGNDIFVHASDVDRAGLKNLMTGQRVSFNEAPSKKGSPKAVNIRIIED